MSEFPADPDVGRAHYPESLDEDEAAERIHEFLRGYEDSDLLGGWVIFHEWIEPDGSHSIGHNVSPGLDWPRVLGIVDAAQMKLRRDYLMDQDED